MNLGLGAKFGKGGRFASLRRFWKQSLTDMFLSEFLKKTYFYIDSVEESFCKVYENILLMNWHKLSQILIFYYICTIYNTYNFFSLYNLFFKGETLLLPLRRGFVILTTRFCFSINKLHSLGDMICKDICIYLKNTD